MKYVWDVMDVLPENLRFGRYRLPKSKNIYSRTPPRSSKKISRVWYLAFSASGDNKFTNFLI